jgi:pimeloyl-ACP methyl ester carboxylesterase
MSALQDEVKLPAKDKKGEAKAMHLDSLRDTRGYKGYSLQQSTRPQTLGYGLADSPAGQAAWKFEKFVSWSHYDGNVETVLNKDEMLDTITLY